MLLLTQVIMLLFTILAAILYSSLVEYSLHRWYLHYNNQHSHIKEHHRIFHGMRSFQSADIPNKEIVSDIGYLGVNVALAIPITLLLFLQELFVMGIFFLIISAVYTIWVEIAHLSFHRPNEGSLKSYNWFLHLMELHRIHHITYRHQFGIGSLWWDYLLGTRTDAKRDYCKTNQRSS